MVQSLTEYLVINSWGLLSLMTSLGTKIVTVPTKKATKRLFVLRTLKRVGLGTNDPVLVYCSIVRIHCRVHLASLGCDFFISGRVNSVCTGENSQNTWPNIIYLSIWKPWSWPAWSLLVAGG